MCIPLRKAWKTEVPGRCSPLLKYVLGTGIPAAIMDCIILAMPYPFIWRLQTSLRRKVSLTITFVVGGLYVPARLLQLPKADSPFKGLRQLDPSLVCFSNTQLFPVGFYVYNGKSDNMGLHRGRRGRYLCVFAVPEAGLFQGSSMVCRTKAGATYLSMFCPQSPVP